MDGLLLPTNRTVPVRGDIIFEEPATASPAFRAFNNEAFTLLAIAVLVTGLRVVARVRHVGIRSLFVDDYFAVLGVVSTISWLPNVEAHWKLTLGVRKGLSRGGDGTRLQHVSNHAVSVRG